MRIELLSGLDHSQLQECADGYGRPSVRWLLRFAEKNHIIES
jgi:hypothetical protein